MKTCGTCGKNKTRQEFYTQKEGLYGLRGSCKACLKAYNHENRERISDLKRKHYQENKEQKIEYQRKYKRENAGLITSKRHELYYKRPELLWADNYTRRVKGYGFGPVVEGFTLADLLALYGDSCWHCGGPREELDHYPVAVSKGGSHTLDNVRPSCLKCNRPGNNVRK